MAKQAITSCSALVDELSGVVEYRINDRMCTREDYVAMQLARIAGALEADIVDDEGGEQGSGGGNAGEDLFGQKA